MRSATWNASAASVAKQRRRRSGGAHRKFAALSSLSSAGAGFGSSPSNEVSTTGEASEIAATDQLIDTLVNASDSQLPELVAQSLLRLDTAFYMRIAARADTASSDAEREQLQSLADKVMRLSKQVVKAAEGVMDASAVTLQDILASASDDSDGEFYVPLTESNINRLRDRIENRFDDIDESVISTAFAWMQKSQEQQMDGMVAIIQRMLQLYGGIALAKSVEQAIESTGSDDSSASVALRRVLRSDRERWAKVLSEVEQSGLQEAFLGEVETLMQEVVTALPKGSQEQRVHAEVLKELDDCAREQWQGYDPRSKPMDEQQ